MKLKIFSLFVLVTTLVFSLSAQTPQRKQYVDGKVWVKIKPALHRVFPSIQNPEEISRLSEAGFPEIETMAKEFGLQQLYKAFPLNDPLINDIFTFRLNDFENTPLFVRKMEALPYVEYAEQAPMVYPDYTPNDYNALQQWHLPKIMATQAWDISRGDTNISIAIVDDAFRLDHEDIGANIWRNKGEIPGNSIDDDGNGYIDDYRGWDAADNDNDPMTNTPNIDCNSAAFLFCHGTGVAHCAAGVTNNGKGTPSIGFNCRIIPVKCQENGNTTGGIDAGYEGIAYAAAAKARVMNLSWGGTGFSQTAQNIITAAHNAGVVIIASAGNDNVSTPHYPSNFKYVISVGATDANDNKSGFSNYMDSVDVMAPGSNIKMARADGLSSYFNTDGTSFSSPIVAGLCGLMLSANPCLSPQEVEYYLKSTCDSIPHMTLPQYVGKLGAGRINAFKAMEAVKPTAAPTAAFNYNVQTCGGVVQYNYAPTGLFSCPTTYNWTFVGGTPMTATGPNPVVTYATSGNYDVILAVNNGLGTNVGTQTVNITVNALPMANAGPDLTGCNGTQVQVNATASPNVTYLWTPNIGISSTTVPNPVFSLSSSRNYYLTVTDANGCQYTDTLFIGVNLNPTIYAGADQTSSGPGAQVQLDATCSTCQTFSWDPATDLSNPSIKNPVSSTQVTRTYTVFGTNASGCTKADAVVVTVPGTTALDELNGQYISVLPAYPNPANSEVTFKASFTNVGTLSLHLFNMTGSLVENVYTGNISQGTFEKTMTRNQIPSGIYMAVWEYNGERLTQKVSFE